MRRRVQVPAKEPRSAYAATVANTVSACGLTVSQKEKPRTNRQGLLGDTLGGTLSEKQTKEGLGAYTISKKRESGRILSNVPKHKG